MVVCGETSEDAMRATVVWPSVPHACACWIPAKMGSMEFENFILSLLPQTVRLRWDEMR